jgi:hypothetical protein
MVSLGVDEMAIRLMGMGSQDDNARSWFEAHSHAKPGSTFAEWPVLAEFFARNEP